MFNATFTSIINLKQMFYQMFHQKTKNVPQLLWNYYIINFVYSCWSLIMNDANTYEQSSSFWFSEDGTTLIKLFSNGEFLEQYTRQKASFPELQSSTNFGWTVARIYPPTKGRNTGGQWHCLRANKLRSVEIIFRIIAPVPRNDR